MPEMSDHDFRTVVDALCARFQADLQAQATELASRQTVEREKLAQETESHWAQRLDNVREEWNGRLQAGLADAAADAERRLAAEAERARLEVEALTASAAEATERHKKELDAVREEWQGRMQAGIADVTADADRRVIAETDRIRREAEEAAAASVARLREELEQATSQATGRLREEMDQALAAERERADVDLQGERSRVHALISERDHIASDLEAEHLKTQTLSLALEEAQAAATRERESARAAMAATETRHQQQGSEKDAQAVIEARAAERQAQLAAFERMLASVRAIGSARSLSDTLNALVDAAGAIAPRAALFITSPASDAASAGMHLQGWKAVGFAGDGFAKLRIATTDAAAAGCLGPAVTEGRPVATMSSPAPSFANLPAQRAGLAVPIAVGGTSVAVLYADDALLEEPESPASWPEGSAGTGCPWLRVPGADNGSSNCPGRAADSAGGDSDHGRGWRRQCDVTGGRQQRASLRPPARLRNQALQRSSCPRRTSEAGSSHSPGAGDRAGPPALRRTRVAGDWRARCLLPAGTRAHTR